MYLQWKLLFSKDENVFANSLLQGYKLAVILAKKPANYTK